MPEILRYTKVFAEDLALGTGYREVRLQDSRVVLLQQIHLGLLLPFHTVSLPSVNGASVLTASGVIQAGWRVMGVTARVQFTFGASGGLSTLGIGDPVNPFRWGSTLGRTAESESDMSFFESGDMPIYAVNTNLLVTAVGGLFDAAGQVELQIHYFTLRHRR